MKNAAKATLLAAAVLMTPAAAFAGTPGKTRTTTQTAATTTTTTTTTTTKTTPVASTTTTTPASTPSTTITTPTPAPYPTGPLAPARTANLISGRIALLAYEQYLETLVSDESDSKANDAAFVNTVEGGCKSSLEPLTQSTDSLKPGVQFTLTALGKEAGDDLALNYDAVAIDPFVKLSATLTHLHWVHPGRNPQVIQNYITAETALLSLTQSNLCQDALLAATKPAMTPDATKVFIKQYQQTVSTASSSLGAFLVLLHAYVTPAQQPLAKHITALATEFTRDAKSDLLASAQQLTSGLETS